MKFKIKQEPHFTINWKNIITGENNEIAIYGNEDKPTGIIYYTCIINDKRKYILSRDSNKKWSLENIIPPLNDKEKGLFKIKENEFIENIGKIINVYNILYEIENI